MSYKQHVILYIAGTKTGLSLSLSLSFHPLVSHVQSGQVLNYNVEYSM
jgi:hypothetical protein